MADTVNLKIQGYINNFEEINRMDYSKIYYKIIENRKDHPYDGYVECHHIVPKSLGGTNDNSNLVNLSAREHFICHLLLTKMYSEGTSNYYKMIKAFMMMLVCQSKGQQRVLNSKRYEFLRVKFSEAQSLSQLGEKNSQFGKTKSLELRKKISERTRESLHEKGFGKKKQLKQQKSIDVKDKRKKDIDLYRNYYIIYEEVGFDELVVRTGYNKSQPNLVQRFKRLLPEFEPQNGKKRGQ
jgi:hypothetical protein